MKHAQTVGTHRRKQPIAMRNRSAESARLADQQAAASEAALVAETEASLANFHREWKRARSSW